MPNLENIKMWVVALRQPERKQTRGELHNDNGMCCLGVACVVAPLEELRIRVRQTPNNTIDGDEGFTTAYDGMTGTLPRSIRDWYGFVDGNPYFSIPDWLRPKIVDQFGEDVTYYPTSSATNLNDTYKFNFLEISDCVVLTFGLEESLGYVTKP
jgi:hypothetical protein